MVILKQLSFKGRLRLIKPLVADFCLVLVLTECIWLCGANGTSGSVKLVFVFWNDLIGIVKWADLRISVHTKLLYKSHAKNDPPAIRKKCVTKWRNLHLWVWAIWFCDYTWRICHTSLTPSKPRQNSVLHSHKIYVIHLFSETDTANEELMSNNWWEFVQHHASLWANV